MADRSIIAQPQFIDDESVLIKDRKVTFWSSLDKALLIIVGMLLALGGMMVFSATFDWSLAEYGSETALLVNHARNVITGIVAMVVFSIVDLRVVKRLSVIIMLMAISFLIAVLLFGDDTFGARRALINGRFQPGEFSELAMIIYMAAWLGSKNVRVRSFTFGLIPFVVLVAIVTGLVMAQPDLSTATVIFITAGIMFFLAGADIKQIVVSIVIITLLLFLIISLGLLPNYAGPRIESWIAGVNDYTQASYHIQQAIISLQYGGWTGLGLGESEGKFLALPAPHTDSIFAVIGEELGVAGAAIVILLYIAFAFRGFQISYYAKDAFGRLMAAGITIWVSVKAMLNIAVMIALIPPTGLPLPFISFGGSSLVVLLVGVGLLLAIQRETVVRQNTPERRKSVAHYDYGGGDRRSRVSRTSRYRVNS